MFILDSKINQKIDSNGRDICYDKFHFTKQAMKYTFVPLKKEWGVVGIGILLSIFIFFWIFFLKNDEAFNDNDKFFGGEPIYMPTVYRMWKNLSYFPVKAERWRELRFRVIDVDHDGAYYDVRRAGFADVWNKLPNYAAKADLWRYITLFKNGGWYADADVIPLAGLAAVSKIHDTVLFNEACGSKWFNLLKYYIGLSTITRAPQFRLSIFAAPQAWPPLISALQLLKQRVETMGTRKWQNTDNINLTGPGLFTDAIMHWYRTLIQNSTAVLFFCSEQKQLFKHLGMGTWRNRQH